MCLQALARADEGCEQLITVPGMGLIFSISMVASVIGYGAAFSKGRDFAAWLGLVPRQMSTGDRHHPAGSITRRGNRGTGAHSSSRALCAVSGLPKGWGRPEVLDRGSPPRPGACIAMFSAIGAGQISWCAYLVTGSWHRDVAIRAVFEASYRTGSGVIEHH